MKFPNIFLIVAVALAPAIYSSEPYTIETIPFPEGVPPEVGAIGFTPSGDLAVALRRSDLIVATPTQDPTKFEWRLFASGLHNACGMNIVSDDEIIVSQMAELTRLVDTDKDGSADLYESLASPWGMSGNYHETNHLVPDGKGGYFVAIGTASHNGPVFYNVKGDYSKVGRRGRNFAAATWKGWVLHIDQEGETTPWASGFRMHNGILLDSKGNLWSGDNQGDWKAATPFYHVEQGNFYGHVSSLVWDPDWDSAIDPLDLPLEKINAMKTPPAIQLPHAEMNRSASEPVEIPEGDVFGPYGGQILLPDNNGERLTRLMLEEVDGIYQGACAQFWEGNGLRLGNNRIVFSPDKTTLYVGQTSRGWGQIAEGLQRISFSGNDPFDVKTMTLTKTGFRLEFTDMLPEDAASSEHFKFTRHRYEDTGNYGGDKLDESEIGTTEVRLVDDRTIEIDLEKLEDSGWVYEMKMDGFSSAKGQGLRTGLFYYTVNRLKP
ncbi:MAG: hypothetical protein P1U58_02070 [Verrucomicrobiales bacterium]|nr:hypothetical protein [Verrucomicrobiales bacterium]